MSVTMSLRTFFRSHSVSKILGIAHVTEGGQIVGHSVRKITKYNKKTNKSRSILILFESQLKQKALGYV